MGKIYSLIREPVTGFVRPPDLSELTCDDAHLLAAVRAWLLGEDEGRVAVILGFGERADAIQGVVRSKGWTFLAQTIREEVQVISRSALSRLNSTAITLLQQRLEKGDPSLITVTDADGEVVTHTVYKPLKARDLIEVAAKAKQIDESIDARLAGLDRSEGDEHLHALAEMLAEHTRRKREKQNIIDITPHEADPDKR